VSFSYVIGIFLDDGQVCQYSNFNKNGIEYESGDILQLPRWNKEGVEAVVILGIHGMNMSS